MRTALATILAVGLLTCVGCDKKPAPAGEPKKVDKPAEKAEPTPEAKPKAEPAAKPKTEPAAKPKPKPEPETKVEPAAKPKTDAAAKAPVKLAPAPSAKKDAPKGDWCVILGAWSQNKLNRALAAAAKAVEKGFGEAAVYAGDDFANLTWGGVVAIGMFGDRKAARDAAKKVKKAKLKGFAKKCIRRDGPPKAVKAASDLPKPKAFAGGPLTWKPGSPREDKRPCFAWSPKTQTALCLVSRFDSLKNDETVSDTLYWITAKARRKVAISGKALAKKLAADGFKAWDDATLGTRDFSNTKAVRWSVPKIVTVKWSRRTELEEMVSDSDRVAMVKSHDDVIDVDCGGGGDTAIEASPYASSGRPFATLLPGRRALLVEWLEKGWVAGEGHMGRRQDAVLVDLADLCGLDEE